MKALVLVVVFACESSSPAPPAKSEPAASQPAAPTLSSSRPLDAASGVPPHGDTELFAAAEAFVKANAAPGLKATLRITVRDGGFAQLQAIPARPDSEQAMVFMKWNGSAWEGVDIGSSISCDDLVARGFPAVVRRGCD